MIKKQAVFQFYYIPASTSQETRQTNRNKSSLVAFGRETQSNDTNKLVCIVIRKQAPLRKN